MNNLVTILFVYHTWEDKILFPLIPLLPAHILSTSLHCQHVISFKDFPST